MYIGQGLGCTIEVKDTAQVKTSFLAIYDFGSTAGNTAPAMTYARNCVLNRTPNGAAAPVIDVIYVSHLDADHYNGLTALSNSIDYPQGQPVIPNVNHFFIGGIHNVNQLPQAFQTMLTHFNIANAVNIPNGYKHAGNDPYTPPLPPPQPPPFGPVPPPAPPSIVHAFSHYVLRLIPLLYRADLLHHIHQQANILINEGSIVLLATIINTNLNPPISVFSALFTGDATMGTLGTFLNANPIPLTAVVNGNFQFTQEYKFVTVPHHGSERTVRDLLNGHAPHTFHALNSFLGNYSPHTAVVSAQSPNWKHPRASVMERFGAVATMGAQVPAAPLMVPAPPLNPQHNLLTYAPIPPALSPAVAVQTQSSKHLYTTVTLQNNIGVTATFSEANNNIAITTI